MHEPDSIKERLSRTREHDYLGDALLGGIDGCVTTFAIVAGVVGGGFGSVVALAIGLSNLLADGFSMAISNYHASKSLEDHLNQKRNEELHHIDTVPEGEREEIRQIFSQKGFEGEVLEKIIETITADVDVWVDTMIQEEHGLPLEAPRPFKSAWVTFLSFLFVGLMPLLPFFYIYNNMKLSFTLSCITTGFAFLAIGIVKGYLLKMPLFKEAMSVLVMGATAAGVAYGVSYCVSTYFGSFI
jgi:vacuolar iron transporter family protein